MVQKLYVRILKYALIVILALISFFPVYWTITMAFKPFAEWTSATGKIFWAPNHLTLKNFKDVFPSTTGAFFSPIPESALPPLIHSFVIVVVATIIAMVVGVLAAYGVSRYKKGGQLPFFLLQLRMFPPIAVIIPIMIMWAFLRMIDTWYGMVIIYATVTLPFSTWLMKTFYDDIPRELSEAAVVDGYTDFEAFKKVVLPLAKGGIASTALFVFILNWSDFLIAYIITDKDWATIPVHINKLQTALVGQLYGPKAALALIALIPPVVFGILIQKYLVRGLTFGAIKK